jgi:hypothetical protein
MSAGASATLADEVVAANGSPDLALGALRAPGLAWVPQGSFDQHEADLGILAGNSAAQDAWPPGRANGIERYFQDALQHIGADVAAPCPLSTPVCRHPTQGAGARREPLLI